MTRTMMPVSLLYSLLAGPVAWFIHFVLVWSVAEFGCRINFVNLELVSPANIRTFVVVTTLIALVAVAIAGLLAYRSWGATPGHRTSAVDAASTAEYTEYNRHSGWAFEDRYQFLAIVAMLLNGLFVVSIIATAMPAFFLDVCDLAA
jgi:hypothetical protein